MSLKRPVRQIEATGQLSLVDRPVPQQGRQEEEEERSGSEPARELMFKEGEPEAIWFGDRSLRTYLQEADLGFAFLIRSLLEDADWSEFEAKYRAGGRPPYAPAVMVGIILYGLTRGISSLRGLEQLARQDLVCQWVTGGLCPDHATIGRFINLHAEAIAGPFFEEMTAKILGCLPEVDRELSGDGTLIESAASRYKSLKLEAAEEHAQQARQKAERYPDDAELAEQADKAEAVAQEVRKRGDRRQQRRHGKAEETRIHPEDPDAYYHRLKDKRFGYAYVPSILVNRQRMIVAQTVDPAREIDVVEGEVDQAKRVIGQIDRLMLDANYFCFDILNMAADQRLDLLCPPPEQASQKQRKKFPKSAFDYDPGTDTCTCPAGETMQRVSEGYDKELDQHYGYYETDACEGCPLRDQCTESARGRRIKRWKDDELKDAARWVMSQPQAQETYKQRNGSVEPVFGELRHIQGLDRFRRTGTDKVAVEFALHAIAHNLRRLKALMGATKEGLCERFGEAGGAIWAYFAHIEWRLHCLRRSYGLDPVVTMDSQLARNYPMATQPTPACFETAENRLYFAY